MGNIAELYEILGVEQPAAEETGANEQEVAEPAEAGANEQEVAEPADNDLTEDPETESPEEPANSQQTRQQRAEQARRRREAEKNDAVAQAVQAEREKFAAELKELFRKANMRDPATGAPIESLEQFNAWYQTTNLAAAQKDLKAGRLTPEGMEQLIENSPTVKRAREQLEQAEQAAQQLKNSQHQQRVQEELAEIRKLNPKVQTLSDILAMDTGRAWAGYVQNNNLSYLDAYRLANADSIREQDKRVAGAGAQLRAQGKEHLKPDAVRGQTTPDMSKRTLELYRYARPDLTDEQIRQDYLNRSR